jgi:hypothetical protein
LPFEMDRRHALLCRECCDHFALAQQHRVRGDKDRVRAFTDEGFERRGEIILAGHIEYERLLSENPRCRLGVVLLHRRTGIVRIHQERHLGSRGEPMEHLNALGANLAGDGADAGYIAARAIVTGDQTDLDRVRADGEDDRDSRCGCLGRECRADVSGAATLRATSSAASAGSRP